MFATPQGELRRIVAPISVHDLDNVAVEGTVLPAVGLVLFQQPGRDNFAADLQAFLWFPGLPRS